jgi:hypothetical protein
MTAVNTSGYQRKYPTTGYWIFVCNTKFWNADQWLELGERQLLYKISEHHRHDFVPGQKGVLRLNNDVRSKARRLGRPPIAAGVYAIFEVTGSPQYTADSDPRGYTQASDASERAWRVPVKIFADLSRSPVLVSDLPREEIYKHIRSPLPTSTLALKREAFDNILERAGLQRPGDLSPDLSDEQLAGSFAGIGELERRHGSDDPKRRHRVSALIERGSVGRAVKNFRGARCQACEALGIAPVAFIDRNGRGFAEAHHVIPVSTMRPGVLSHLNIMVLCPNHHRQAHYGAFEILGDGLEAWEVLIDGVPITLSKPTSAQIAVVTRQAAKL